MDILEKENVKQNRDKVLKEAKAGDSGEAMEFLSKAVELLGDVNYRYAENAIGTIKKIKVLTENRKFAPIGGEVKRVTKPDRVLPAFTKKQRKFFDLIQLFVINKLPIGNSIRM